MPLRGLKVTLTCLVLLIYDLASVNSVQHPLVQAKRSIVSEEEVNRLILIGTDQGERNFVNYFNDGGNLQKKPVMVKILPGKTYNVKKSGNSQSRYDKNVNPLLHLQKIRHWTHESSDHEVRKRDVVEEVGNDRILANLQGALPVTDLPPNVTM